MKYFGFFFWLTKKIARRPFSTISQEFTIPWLAKFKITKCHERAVSPALPRFGL
jgi:hypothetical protein